MNLYRVTTNLGKCEVAAPNVIDALLKARRNTEGFDRVADVRVEHIGSRSIRVDINGEQEVFDIREVERIASRVKGALAKVESDTGILIETLDTLAHAEDLEERGVNNG